MAGILVLIILKPIQGSNAVSHLYAQPDNTGMCKHPLLWCCESSKCKPFRLEHQTVVVQNFEKLPATANNPLRAYFRALPWHNNNKKPQRICWRFVMGRIPVLIILILYGSVFVAHNYQHPVYMRYV
jgi:hypothetical protein